MNLWRWSAILGGAVIGSALIGAGVAVLFMPQSGPATRRQIRQSGDKLQAWLQTQFDRVTDSALGGTHERRIRGHASGASVCNSPQTPKEVMGRSS